MSDRRGRVLIVEDDAALRRLLVSEVEDRGLEVRGAPTAESARELLDEWPADVVVSDIRLPGASGRDLLRWGVAVPDGPDFVIITAFGSVREAVECLQAGAADFLTKPLDLDHLGAALDRVLELRLLRRQVAEYREALGEPDFHGMVGRSEPMRELFSRVGRIAGADGPVLVVGESGTGKELVARAIHAESPRAQRPFVAVNCAGIPEHLLESEFFGHVEGAFTGARRARRGLFEEADGGTLMLDEIGEMPAGLQAKLLRVLQDGRVRPVGSNREREVDVRIVASTNRDLQDDVASGRFREDLYFRLETFTLEVPPLRERGGDLDLLLAHYLNLHALRAGKKLDGFTVGAMQRLQRHTFPGNVRELRNVVERAVTFATGPLVEEEDLPDRVRAAKGGDTARESGLPDGLLRPGDDMLPTLREVERRYIDHVLDRVDGNKRRAAALLGIARRTLYRRLEEDGTEAPDAD
jgi:two-component system, NtrC family, response regulator AtoC